MSIVTQGRNHSSRDTHPGRKTLSGVQRRIAARLLLDLQSTLTPGFSCVVTKDATGCRIRQSDNPILNSSHSSELQAVKIENGLSLSQAIQDGIFKFVTYNVNSCAIINYVNEGQVNIYYYRDCLDLIQDSGADSSKSPNFQRAILSKVNEAAVGAAVSQVVSDNIIKRSGGTLRRIDGQLIRFTIDGTLIGK